MLSAKERAFDAMRQAARQIVNAGFDQEAERLASDDEAFERQIQSTCRVGFIEARHMPLFHVIHLASAKIERETARRHHHTYDFPGHRAAIALKKAAEIRAARAHAAE